MEYNNNNNKRIHNENIVWNSNLTRKTVLFVEILIKMSKNVMSYRKEEMLIQCQATTSQL